MCDNYPKTLRGQGQESAVRGFDVALLPKDGELIPWHYLSPKSEALAGRAIGHPLRVDGPYVICKLLQPYDLLGAVPGGALLHSLLGWLTAALWHLPFYG